MIGGETTGPTQTASKHDPERVLAAWCTEARARESEHLQAARHYEKQNRMVRLAAFLLSTTVGASLLASVNIPQIDVKILLGLLSLGSALLSGLPNTLRSAELAGDHHKAAVRFGELRREIQQVRAIGVAPDQTIEEVITSFRKQFDVAIHESPTLRRSSIRFIAKRSDEARQGGPAEGRDVRPRISDPAHPA
jgi:hypothetical protein